MSKHVMRIHPRGLHRRGMRGLGGAFDLGFTMGFSEPQANLAPSSSGKTATFLTSLSTNFAQLAPSPKTTNVVSFDPANISAPGRGDWAPETELKRASNAADAAREDALAPDVQVGGSDLPVPSQDVEPGTQEIIVDGDSRVVAYGNGGVPSTTSQSSKIFGLPWWQAALIGVGVIGAGVFALRAFR